MNSTGVTARNHPGLPEAVPGVGVRRARIGGFGVTLRTVGGRGGKTGVFPTPCLQLFETARHFPAAGDWKLNSRCAAARFVSAGRFLPRPVPSRRGRESARSLLGRLPKRPGECTLQRRFAFTDVPGLLHELRVCAG